MLIPRSNFGFPAIAAVALLAVSPALAQTNEAATAQPGTDIGPSELSNFSLNGSVTRPADRPREAPATPAPVRPEPAATEPARPAPAVERPAASTAPSPDNGRARPDDILTRPPTLPQATTSQAPASSTQPAPGFGGGPSMTIPPAEQGFSLLPWLAALLFAAGAGAILWFVRQRRTERYASVGPDLGDVLAPEPVQRSAPEPAPRAAPPPRHDPVPPRTETPPPLNRGPLPTTLMPRPAAPASPPATAPAAPPSPQADVPVGGIVSTGLRPWIDIDLVPERALFDDDGAAIAFDIILVNSGNAPARDVTVEAQLLNAGNQQDFELSAFFGTPKVMSDPIPLVAPFARVSLRSAVRIARDKIREYEVEGRKLFMPMVGVSVRYRWSNGDGQTGAGFLVGRGKEEVDRLSPLRLDQGARSWDGLGARRYEKGLRR